MRQAAGMEGDRATILVVDDEFDIRDMLDLGLSLDGYRVLTAAGGEQAIAIARQERIDLLITDFKMPGMNGIETASRIREIAAGVPVVVITGYLTPSTEKECGALGGVRLVRKPFELETLTAVIEAAIRPT